MHESKSIFVIEMRMSVDVCFVSVGGPSGMTNSYEVVMLSLSLILQSLDAVSSESVA
jgi:hypothetical protein